MPLRIWVIGMRTSSVPSGNETDGTAEGLAARPTDAGAADGAAEAADDAGAADGAAGAGAAAPAGDAAGAAGLVPSASDWPPTDWPIRCGSTEFVTSPGVV